MGSVEAQTTQPTKTTTAPIQTSGLTTHSASSSASPAPPSVIITPASPTNTASPKLPPPLAITGMKQKEKAPTDSETALLTQEKDKRGPSAAGSTMKPAGTIETLTRRLSGKSMPRADASKASGTGGGIARGKDVKPASTSTTTPTPKGPTTNPAPGSTSNPAQSSSRPGTHKKKRKRKGITGLLAALGCLSTSDLDDEKDRRDMVQKPGAGVVKPIPTRELKSVVTPEVKELPVEGSSIGHITERTEMTGTTGTTLAGDDIKDKAAGEAVRSEEVVVAPIEPVLPPVDETAGLTSSAVQPPGSGSELLSTPHRPHTARRESDTATPTVAGAGTSSGEAERTETSGGYSDISDSEVRGVDESSGAGEGEGEYAMEEEYEDEEDRLIAQGGMGIPLDEHGRPAPLLPPLDRDHHGRKCLVLDLDETLLHSSFKMLPTADYIVPVEIESHVHNVYVIKRPGVDNFLKEMGKIYEVVVFTASLSKYADPVLDMLDVHRVVRHRLFRESCYNHKGNYVKDLSQLGRAMETAIIIDNSPASYIFHPNNAVPVSTWFNDPHDTELTDLCPFLADLATVEDVRGVLDGSI